MADRPEFLTEDMLNFLDGMREEGQINMFGAGPYVRQAFDLTKKQARKVMVYWMETFHERHPEGGASEND